MLEVSDYALAMEQELARHLAALAERFGSVRKLEESTVGRMCAADGRFFSRLRDGKTFTAKKYDEVVAWFDENWPEFVAWPDDVPRPVKAEASEPVAA